jgi:murein DD-endopeptidase MepM/ murein hydrolase activator NlpD
MKAGVSKMKGWLCFCVSMVLLSGCAATNWVRESTVVWKPDVPVEVESHLLVEPDFVDPGPPPESVQRNPSAPRIWPVDHTERAIISWYGVPRGSRRLHKGMDIKAPLDSVIVASAPGVVTKSCVQGAYGHLVVIDHGNGFQTYYAHLRTRSVHEGQQVQKGQEVGRMGSSGNASTHHLHYEVVYEGQCMDPLYFLPAIEPGEVDLEAHARDTE